LPLYPTADDGVQDFRGVYSCLSRHGALYQTLKEKNAILPGLPVSAPFLRYPTVR
jgi:hypothetical protein